MNNDDKYITIVDEEGVETLAEVLFTFSNQDDNYVLMTLVNEIEDAESVDEEYPVLAYKYEELEDGSIGNLIEIEENDEKSWSVVEEMFNAFEDSEFEL
jgi:uncharacterized protein YrzB (UPF0473 family)